MSVSEFSDDNNSDLFTSFDSTRGSETLTPEVDKSDKSDELLSSINAATDQTVINLSALAAQEAHLSGTAEISDQESEVPVTSAGETLFSPKGLQISPRAALQALKEKFAPSASSTPKPTKAVTAKSASAPSRFSSRTRKIEAEFSVEEANKLLNQKNRKPAKKRSQKETLEDNEKQAPGQRFNENQMQNQMPGPTSMSGVDLNKKVTINFAGSTKEQIAKFKADLTASREALKQSLNNTTDLQDGQAPADGVAGEGRPLTEQEKSQRLQEIKTRLQLTDNQLLQQLENLEAWEKEHQEMMAQQRGFWPIVINN